MKRIVIGVLVLCIIVLLPKSFRYIYPWGYVDSMVTNKDTACKELGHDVRIRIINTSPYSIQSMSINFNGKYPGHSSKIDRTQKLDNIIQPNQVYDVCFKFGNKYFYHYGIHDWVAYDPSMVISTSESVSFF